jgi:hypothetical protein
LAQLLSGDGGRELVRGGLAARLRNAAAGRAPSEALFLQSDGQPWRDGDHKRPYAKAAAAAGVGDATIYSLRHSSIARMLLRGLPIRLVAELHNTSTPIIEAHYGRFIARHGDDLIRAALIDTSPAPSADNIVPLERARAL